MDQFIKEFIAGRIENTLTRNEEYIELQDLAAEYYCSGNKESHLELIDKIETLVEELCYIQGFKDAIRMIENVNK